MYTLNLSWIEVKYSDSSKIIYLFKKIARINIKCNIFFFLIYLLSGQGLLIDMKDYEKGEALVKRSLLFHPEEEFLIYDLAIAQSQLFNCEVMDTFIRFKRLCKEKKCSDNNLNWIKNSEKIFKKRGFCPK